MYCKFNDACYVRGKLFASASNMNGLFSIDIKTHKVNYITSFPQDPLLSVDLHSKVISIGDTLFFIPLNGTGISIVQLSDYSFTFIASEVKYVNAIVHKDSIYLIPYQLSDGLWRYLIEEKIVIKTDIKLLNKQLSLGDNLITDWYGSLIVDDYLYIVISGTGNIIKLNLMSGASELIQFEGNQFANIAYIEEWFYITHNECPCIYKTKMIKDSLIKIEIPEKKEIRTTYRVLEYNHHIICLPCFGDIIYQYDSYNDDFQILHINQNNEYIDVFQTKYAGTVIINDKLILLPKGDPRMIELDMESVTSYKLFFDGFPEIDNRYRNSILLFESKTLGLNDYIHMV